MPAAEQRDEQLIYHLALPDNDLADFIAQLRVGCRQSPNGLGFFLARGGFGISGRDNVRGRGFRHDAASKRSVVNRLTTRRQIVTRQFDDVSLAELNAKKTLDRFPMG